MVWSKNRGDRHIGSISNGWLRRAISNGVLVCAHSVPGQCCTVAPAYFPTRGYSAQNDALAKDTASTRENTADYRALIRSPAVNEPDERQQQGVPTAIYSSSRQRVPPHAHDQAEHPENGERAGIPPCHALRAVDHPSGRPRRRNRIDHGSRESRSKPAWGSAARRLDEFRSEQ